MSCVFGQEQRDALFKVVIVNLNNILKRGDAFSIKSYVQNIYNKTYQQAIANGMTMEEARNQALTNARLIPGVLYDVVANRKDHRDYLRDGKYVSLDNLDDLVKEIENPKNGVEALQKFLEQTPETQVNVEAVQEQVNARAEEQNRLTEKETQTAKEKAAAPAGTESDTTPVVDNDEAYGEFGKAAPASIYIDHDFELDLKTKQLSPVAKRYYTIKRAIIKAIKGSQDTDAKNITIDGTKGFQLVLRSSGRIAANDARQSKIKNAEDLEEFKNGVAMVLVDKNGSDIFINENGNIVNSKKGKLAYWSMPKITPDMFDTKGNYVPKTPYQKTRFAEMIDSLRRNKNITKAEAIAILNDEFTQVMNIREYIAKNPETNELRVDITGGSLGWAVQDMVWLREPMSKLNLDNEDVNFTTHSSGLTTFNMKDIDKDIAIERPYISAVKGMARKLASIIVDDLYHKDGTKVKPIERQALLDQYFHTKAGTLQMLTTEEGTKVLLDGKELDTSPAGREASRTILEDYFDKDVFVSNVKTEDKLTKNQHQNIKTGERTKAQPRDVFDNGDGTYDIMDSHKLHVLKGRAADAIFSDINIIKDGEKAILEPTGKSYLDFIKDNYSINYKIDEKGKIERYNAYMTYRLTDSAKKELETPSDVIQKAKEAAAVIPETLKEGTPETSIKQNLDDVYDMSDSEFEKRMYQKEKNRTSTNKQIEDAKSWYENHPLSKHFKYEEMFNMVNKKNGFQSVAKWSMAGIILYQGSDHTDLYHEAFHGFFQSFLTVPQKMEIFNELKKMSGTFQDYQGNYTKFAYASYRQLEEYLAEDFREFMLKGTVKKPTPAKLNFFQRLLNALRALFTGITINEVATNDSSIAVIHELYDKLRIGNLSEYTFAEDNITFGEMDKGMEAVAEGETITSLSHEDSALIVDSLDSLISEYVDMVNAGKDVTEAQRLKFGELLMKQYQGKPLITEEKAELDSLKSKKSYKYTSLLLNNKTGLKKCYNHVLLRFSQIFNDLTAQRAALEIATTKNQAKINDLTKKIDALAWAIRNFGSIDNIDENRSGKGVIGYHQLKSSLLEEEAREEFFKGKLAEESDVEINEADQTLVNAREHSGPGNDLLLKDMASKEVLYLLRSLHEKDAENNLAFNKLGIPKLMSFDRVWNRTARTLQNTRTPEKMFSKIVNESETYPVYQQLLLKLGPVLSTGNNETKLWTNFWQTFNKTYIPLVQVNTEGKTMDNGKVLENPVYQINIGNASIDYKKVGNNWLSEFREFYGGYVERDENGENYLNTKRLLEAFPTRSSASNNVYNFFNAVGFKLDNKKEILDKLKTQSFQVSAEYIWEAIDQVNKRGIIVHEFKDFLKKYDVKTIKINGKEEVIPAKRDDESRYIDLQKLQARYSDDYSNFMVTNAANNTQFEHSLNNSLTVIVNTINEVVDYKDLITLPYMSHLDIKRNPMVKSSIWLNSIFKIRDAEGNMISEADPQFGKRRLTVSGQPVTMDLSNLSGVLMRENESLQGEGIESASADEFTKLIMDFHLTVLKGVPELMRHADKSTSFSVKISNLFVKNLIKGGNTNLYVDTLAFLPSRAETESEDYVSLGDRQTSDILTRHLASELDRINIMKNMTVGAEGFDFNYLDRGKEFQIFDYVLDKVPGLKKQLLDLTVPLEQHLKTPEGIKLKESIDMAFRKYFQEQTEQVTELFSQAPFISDDYRQGLRRTASKNALQSNDKQLDAAAMKSFVINSWIHNIESLAMIYGDPAQYVLEKEEFHKRNAGVGSTGNLYRTDKAFQDYINVEERKKGWQYAKYNTMRRDYDGTFNTGVFEDITMQSVYRDEWIEAITKDIRDRMNPVRDKLSGEERDAKEKDILKAIDAATKAYKEIEETGNAQGWITFDSYRLMMEAEGKWSNQQEKLYQRIVAGEKPVYSEIKEFFPVQKVQYWGPLKTDGLPMNAFHKFSLLPLIPTMFKEGSGLQKLHDRMMANDIDYSLFKSGSKMSTITKAKDQGDKFYSEDAMTKNTIFMEYLKDQLAIAPKFKGKVIFSTQLRKLIENGLVESGVDVDFMPGVDLNTRKAEWDKLSEGHKLLNYPKWALMRDYEKNIGELTKLKMNDLLREAGWKLDAKNNPVGDMKNLFKFLKKELERQNLSEHEIDFLKLDANGNLADDLSLSLSADKIERVLNSIVVNRLVRQKVHGEGLILASGVGFESGPYKYIEEALTNPDGSKRLASSNLETGTIKVNPNVTLEEFSNYIEGRDVGDTSKQKAKVHEALLAEGVDLKKIINTPEKIKEFLRYHEQSHLENRDEHIYWASGRDLLTQDKIDIEIRATADALNKIEGVSRTATPEQIKKYGTNGLRSYYKGKDGKTLPMQVKIALQGNFIHLLDLTHLDGQKIGTLKRLNQMLQEDKWLDKGDHRRMITMTGVRIPVQGHNSMEFMEIAEFLPKEAGSIIIPPIEIVAKSGSDFDIDKLQVMMPSILNKDGVTSYARTGAEGIENEILWNIKQILELDSNYVRLIRPNGTDIVKPLSEELAKYVRPREYRDKDFNGKKVVSGTRILEIGYNLYKHTSNNIGKQVLGMGAVDNTYNALFNRVGAYMNATNSISEALLDELKAKVKRTPAEDKLIKNFRRQKLLMPHNQLTVDGNKVISLSHLLDANQENDIADIINQLINGWVDIAKDAWIFDIQGNREITPTLLFMVQAGVPFETAVYLSSLPLVRAYVKEQKLAKSTFAKPLRKAPSNPNFFRNKARTVLLTDSKYGFNVKVAKDRSISGKDLYDLTVRTIDSVIPADQHFDKSKLEDIIKGNWTGDDAAAYERAAFLHFLEIEEMGKAVRDVKMRMNIDTSKSSTLFEAQNKMSMINALRQDQRMPNSIVEKLLGVRDPDGILTPTSPISSFFVQPFQLGIWGNLFNLRNHVVMNNFLAEKFRNGIFNELSSTYPNNPEKFANEFRNSFTSYIFQNSVNTFSLSGLTHYKGLNINDSTSVKTLPSLSIGAYVKNGTMYISKDDLREQYKLLSKGNTTEDINKRYRTLGLAPIESKEAFTNSDLQDSVVEDQYYRFVLERENLRALLGDKGIKSKEFELYVTKNALSLTKRENETDQEFDHRFYGDLYEMFLRDKALDNNLNAWKIFRSKNNFASQYKILLASLEKTNPELKKNYLLLSMLALSQKSGYTNLKLVNNLLDADTIDILHENIKMLSDRTEIKVADKELNDMISDFFSRLPLVAFLQSGLSTKGAFSLTRLVPQDQYLAIMKKPVEQYTKKLDNEILEDYYQRFLFQNHVSRKTIRARYQDYVTSPEMRKNSPVLEDVDTEVLVNELGPGITAITDNIGTYSMEYLNTKIQNEKGRDISTVDKLKDLIAKNPNTVFVYNFAKEGQNDAVRYDYAFTQITTENKAGISTRQSYQNKVFTDDIDVNGAPVINPEVKATIDKEIAILQEHLMNGKTLAFVNTGYGQYMVGAEPIGKTTKNYAPVTFEYLSKELFDKFGYKNGTFAHMASGKKVIQETQELTDAEVRESMKQCKIR
jgi:hypothetical protein